MATANKQEQAPSAKENNTKAKILKEKGFEESLWDAANKLRGSVV